MATSAASPAGVAVLAAFYKHDGKLSRNQISTRSLWLAIMLATLPAFLVLFRTPPTLALAVGSNATELPASLRWLPLYASRSFIRRKATET